MQAAEQDGMDESGVARARRPMDWRTGVCAGLALVAAVEGVLLVRLARRGAPTDEPPREAPGTIPYADRRPVRHPMDNQVVYWEAAAELDAVRSQIERLFHDRAAQASGVPRGIPAPPGAGRPLSDLQAEIERLFEEAVYQHRAAGLPARLESGWNLATPGAGLHIETQGSNYIVALSLPNCHPSDIRAVLEGALLTIEAPSPASGGPAAAPAARIRLPDDMDRESLQADYRDGILRIRALRGASNSLVRPIAIH